MVTEGSLQATRVLVAHRSGAARRAMRDVLATVGCAVVEAATAEEALTAARERCPDVLLLDAALGRMVTEIKSDPDLFRIAVVIVGPPPDVRFALDVLEHGAHDVLGSDPSPGELVARVRAARRTQALQDQVLGRERDLEALAYYDELTGVANRRFAVRQLHALISRARRHGGELSVVLFDADRFKDLNDRRGHAAGDAILRGLATRLRSRVREEDVVARFGGEEFLIILPDTGASGAAAVAEDVRAGVAAEPFPVGRIAVPLTVSAGWAAWEGDTPDELVARADRGLYAAKDAGRDRVCAGPTAASPKAG